MKREDGFSLIEVMTVVTIVGVLGSLAFMQYEVMTARAKRGAARVDLSSIWSAQQLYYATYGGFAATFPALNSPVDGTPIGANKIQGMVYTYDLSQPWGEQSWRCTATGDIDGDAWPDQLVVWERKPDVNP